MKLHWAYLWTGLLSVSFYAVMGWLAWTLLEKAL